MTDRVVVPPPPRAVSAAFGADAALEWLSGGQHGAWRAGSLVLKPLDQPIAALEWQARHLPALASAADHLRLALPVRAASGSLVVDGWTAWTFCRGQHEPGHWLDIIAAGRRLHRAMRGLARPRFLDERQDRWAVADGIAWGERTMAIGSADARIGRLRAALRRLDDPAQLIHGDLTGNVLFADGMPPAVIDLSPYWRPAGYASAIVVADAIVWEGGSTELAAAIDADPWRAGQLLARALVFRILADGSGGPSSRNDPYAAAIEFALHLTAHDPP